MINRASSYLKTETSIAPLVVFRIAFGALLFLSTLRFALKGWINTMYLQPKMFFPFYGFEWVKPLGPTGMYIVFVLMLLASLGILFGFLYRYATLLFFLLFTYVELIDKTNYLNHYYFVSLVSFICIFIPAGNAFSLDVYLFKREEQQTAPRFYETLLKAQLFLVYFFAGLAKINTDWLLNAQPLKIWLPAFSHFPVIGRWMEEDWIAYFFCWFGCIYDLLIGFFLFNPRTVKWAYVFVILFHMATALFFNIGMFPYIMITITLIFFPADFHKNCLSAIKKRIGYLTHTTTRLSTTTPLNKSALILFILFFSVQIALPFRYLLYPGKLFWTEQGYRFSWRVMLMEKTGTAFFFVQDKKSGREIEVDNKKYLTYMQEKQMAMQPDMLVDYAKFLKTEFQKKGIADPKVRAQVYVTLNGSPSKLFINDTVDLSLQSNSFLKHKSWILPF